MIIKNGSVFLEGRIVTCDLQFEEEITEIGKLDADGLDVQGLYVFPGFIDIHTHGGYGSDFMDAKEEAYENVLAFHAEHGTTSVVATSVTATPEQIESMISFTRQYMKRELSVGARVIGVHVEGPYLSVKNKGAQHESFLRIPARDSYDFILKNADVIKTVTLSPELNGAEKMIRDLIQEGIIVCGGHDDGYYEKALSAIEAGMTHCTHLWCAMSTVHMRNGVRSAGLCEAGLLSDQLTVEVIADNYHISPEMIQLIHKCKGDKMCIVSDSLRAGGMPEGDQLYTLGMLDDPNAQKFIVSDGVAKLPDKSRFAGSIQSLSQMLRNVVLDAKIPLEEAVKMVTSTPADIIHEEKIGRIRCGNKADFCIMNQNLEVIMTIINGKVVYNKESERCLK